MVKLKLTAIIIEKFKWQPFSNPHFVEGKQKGDFNLNI